MPPIATEAVPPHDKNILILRVICNRKIHDHIEIRKADPRPARKRLTAISRMTVTGKPAPKLGDKWIRRLCD